MKTIVIPQFYRGPSGQKGLYNRQEVGLARAFAALGCRAVVLYPEPGAKAPRIETPEPNVKICYMPAVAFGVQAFYKSWQILLDEHADAVHVMGDNSLGVPGLYRFCQKHGILFYSQLGALKSTSNHAAVRRVMDLLLRRNLAVYRKTPTYAKTPAVAAELPPKQEQVLRWDQVRWSMRRVRELHCGECGGITELTAGSADVCMHCQAVAGAAAGERDTGELQEVHYDVPAQGDIAASTLRMVIEAPTSAAPSSHQDFESNWPLALIG